MVKLLFVICIGLALWLGSMMMGGQGAMRSSTSVLGPVHSVGGAAIGVLRKFGN